MQKGCLAISIFVAMPWVTAPQWGNPPLRCAARLSVSEMVISSSLDAGLDPMIAINLAFSESHENQGAVRHERNGSFSRGIFQLNDATARAMGVDATDAATAIPASVAWLAKLVRRGGPRKAHCWWVHGEYSKVCK